MRPPISNALQGDAPVLQVVTVRDYESAYGTVGMGAAHLLAIATSSAWAEQFMGSMHRIAVDADADPDGVSGWGERCMALQRCLHASGAVHGNGSDASHCGARSAGNDPCADSGAWLRCIPRSLQPVPRSVTSAFVDALLHLMRNNARSSFPTARRRSAYLHSKPRPFWGHPLMKVTAALASNASRMLGRRGNASRGAVHQVFLDLPVVGVHGVTSALRGAGREGASSSMPFSSAIVQALRNEARFRKRVIESQRAVGKDRYSSSWATVAVGVGCGT